MKDTNTTETCVKEKSPENGGNTPTPPKPLFLGRTFQRGRVEDSTGNLAHDKKQKKLEGKTGWQEHQTLRKSRNL